MAESDAPCVVHAFHNAAVKRLAWWGLSWKHKAVTTAHRGVIYHPRNPLPYWSPGIDAFLVNSQACMRILRRIGVSSKRLYHVPNCVPDERVIPALSREEVRADLGIPLEDLVFGFIGNNNPVKGAKLLLQAFALAFPEAVPWKLAPVSDGAAGTVRLLLMGLRGREWSDLAKYLGIADRVHFMAYGENVAESLAAMDSFVLPSLSESMPNTLLEAVRFGLPCIGTAVGAVPEILNDCGRCVPPNDIAALAQALADMAHSPKDRARLALQARWDGTAYFPERRITMVESIYDGLLRSKGLVP
jgi:glycosyltransferase involved in cell wall biosynthesis